jgi:hypothetical protein
MELAARWLARTIAVEAPGDLTTDRVFNERRNLGGLRKANRTGSQHDQPSPRISVTLIKSELDQRHRNSQPTAWVTWAAIFARTTGLPANATDVQCANEFLNSGTPLSLVTRVCCAFAVWPG